MDRILITGGAGFVGSHLADRLLAQGYRVRVLDNLTPQVHEQDGWPGYLNPRVERVEGDVRDKGRLRQALRGVSAVFHFAAAVGVGQSMYRVEHYVDTNNRGTAALLEALAQQPVEKLVVASSMSLYGEGLYRNAAGHDCAPGQRSPEQLRAGHWEPHQDGQLLQAVPTPEDKLPDPSSVYALSKYDQECLCLMLARTQGIAATALRFFNIYGPRQALSNPYTGVLAIFSSRLLNGRPPLIFEDGGQQRDFVSVHDVARACVLALEAPGSGQVYNVGSGQAHSVLSVAEKVARTLGCESIEPRIVGEYRVGDVRHCFADIRKARQGLGYRPQVSLEDGLGELADWLRHQRPRDRVEQMHRELSQRGLSL